MKSLVIFDLDGTLLNTIDDLCDSYNESLTDLGLPTVSLEEAKYMVGKGLKINVDNCLRHVLKDEYDNKINLYYEKMLERFEYHYTLNQKNKTKPYPNIISMLEEIRKMGLLIAVLSNKPHFDVIKVMDYYFKGVHFDFIQGVSEDVRVKPNSDGINKIKRELNVLNNDNIIYVGDSETDVLTARNANLDCIACTWGFRKEEEINHADFIAHEALDIVKIIKENYNG